MVLLRSSSPNFDLVIIRETIYHDCLQLVINGNGRATPRVTVSPSTTCATAFRNVAIAATKTPKCVANCAGENLGQRQCLTLRTGDYQGALFSSCCKNNCFTDEMITSKLTENRRSFSSVVQTRALGLKSRSQDFKSLWAPKFFVNY